MKVALVYDRVNKWGGAERVLLALKEIFPTAPLYTSVYHEKTASWAKVFTIRTSFLQKFPYATSHHELLATLMPVAFESFSFDNYDLVISVTSEAAKGIITKSHTTHVCICLTPTRYLWSGYNEYFANGAFRFLSKPVVAYLQKWDQQAAQRPDMFIAISKEVQERIKRYYNRESTVIYPPVTLADHSIDAKSQKNQSFFLAVSRLVPYKRVDIAIEACNKLKLPLKIIGQGVEEKKLRKIAGPTIEFLGSVTDSELIKYYKSCCGLIFPGKEDFGLSIVEANKFATPVIAFRGGGALETVIEGKTGEFFYPQTSGALVQKLQFLLKKGIVFSKEVYSEACIKQAKKFTNEQFNTLFLALIDAFLKKRERI